MKGRTLALTQLIAVTVVVAPLLAVPLLIGAYAKGRCAPTAASQPVDQQADQRADQPLDRPVDQPKRQLVGGLDREQVGYAVVIVETAAQVVERSLSGQAAVIGVMTALTESSLRNVAHGDAAGPDSRGLFQQRDGWGPPEVRMDPAGAARLFFQALVTVAGWYSMAPWQAAQAVQRSAFASGENYAPNAPVARRVVAALTADPGRAARNSMAGCATAQAWDEGGGQQLDRLHQLQQLDRLHRLPGADVAVVRAYAVVGQHGYYQLCARLAARIWGRTHSGYASAAVQWEAMVASGIAHPGDRRPPVGALLFWHTGGPYGHVAVYVGDGRIVSNDIADTTPGQGGVYLVELTAVETRWAATYLGWTPPVYTTPTTA